MSLIPYDAVNGNPLMPSPFRNSPSTKEHFLWRIEREPNSAGQCRTRQVIRRNNDFSRFGRALKEDGSTVRNVVIKMESFSKTTKCTRFADAFLYHMVRRIVFTMVRVGQGRMDPEGIQKALQGDMLKIAPGIAPACGLTLTKVRYNDSK
jgi:tRNA pseudouridine38-40 synthase